MEKISGFKASWINFESGLYRDSFSISEDGHILSRPSANAITLPSNLVVVPGFIDEHIHGAAGFDVMDASAASLTGLTKALPQEGVTAFLATTMSCSNEAIINAIKAVVAFQKSPTPGAMIAGLHLEGPFLSKVHAGAQDPGVIRPFDPASFAAYLSAAEGQIREMTFAYEENGKVGLAELLKNGVTPSIGHSNCTAELFKEGIEAGLHCSTHTYNAMRGFQHREPGIVGEVLLNDNVNAELIADGIHVSPDAIRLLFKCKKKDNIILISDSTEAKYLPLGEYTLGGTPIFLKDGVARLKDGTIAGSVLRLDTALKNIHQWVPSYSFEDLIKLVTLNPAKNLHLDKTMGSIAPHKLANLTIIDHDFNVYATIVKGEVVYCKEGFCL